MTQYLVHLCSHLVEADNPQEAMRVTLRKLREGEGMIDFCEEAVEYDD